MLEPFSPQFKANPHPTYAALRDHDPVRRVTLPSGLPAWLVTRYEDVKAVLADPRLSKDVRRFPDPGRYLVAADLRETISRHMLNADPPDHTRLRKLVSKAFTPRRVEALRPRVQQITEELLDRMAPLGRVDLIDAFAFPLPVTVICELLGVPVEDRDEFRVWSNVIIEGVGAGDRFESAVRAMDKYLRELVEAKRRSPGDDMLSDLIAAREEGDRLSEGELTSMAFLLLVAGHETTVNLIGNGVYLLLTHPDQLALLRSDPGLLPSAVEEFLRYEGPAETSTLRFATEPIEIGGVTIPAGEVVLVALASANRDGRRFADADRLDITRGDSQHLAFGHGIHYCLGASLARLEGQVAIGELLARFPDLALAVPPEELAWRPGTLIRGLRELPVTYSPR
ncbi:cytochrome P450 [Carbonactinospora thermoautotrophica]|uniref:Cytochrome P450 n=1 Tax=Carbonactinospora thermoautotrophica TaxID=1469144 RepID=A0A132NF02_9ACTN|nr:cytochrome P450 [Carbonactinospora thermoautotrophica]KWX08651.1 cytochrome P450 [Carbonactinospora thermoautotrophica]